MLHLLTGCPNWGQSYHHTTATCREYGVTLTLGASQTQANVKPTLQSCPKIGTLRCNVTSTQVCTAWNSNVTADVAPHIALAKHALGRPAPGTLQGEPYKGMALAFSLQQPLMAMNMALALVTAHQTGLLFQCTLPPESHARALWVSCC